MNALQNKYSKHDFTILAIPSNNFGLQEPASRSELLRGLKYVRPGKGFQPMFPMTNKLHVNGDEMHPIYKFLKAACPSSPQEHFSKKERLAYDPMHNSDVRWNFEKFLVGRDGKPIKRYHSSVEPKELHEDIEAALKK